MKEIIVSNSPFMHSKNDVNRLFLFICVALIFPAIFGICFFGLYSLFMIVFSIAFCFIFEVGFNFYLTKKLKLKDISFAVTGLILALSLPPKTPIWVIAVASFFSISVVKIAFGGLGKNYFNPALVGRCAAGMMISDITSSLYTVTIAGDTYTSLIEGGTNTISNLISGYAVGGIGTTCILLLTVIAVVLSIMKIIDYKIPLIAVISYIIVGYNLNDFESTIINMFSGSFIFVAIFMATEPNVSPNNFVGKLIYSIGFGALSALCWNLKFFGENCIFVVALFMNCFVPFMDKYFSPRPSTIGGFRNARKV